MDNQYLTDYTTSLDAISESYEYLIPGSKVKAESSSKEFKSYGDGIISEAFFIGTMSSEHFNKFEVADYNSCIISIPNKGCYHSQLSNHQFINVEQQTGTLALPTDKLTQKASTDIIDEFIIISEMTALQKVLDKNYNIQGVDESLLEIDLEKEKGYTIFSFIQNSILQARNFPDTRDSLLFKENIKGITILLIAELIADLTNKKSIISNSPDLSFVKNAEEIMDGRPESLFAIQEIAEQVCTSPRNLQLAFKKHRDYSPMQFLRDRKLHKVRSLLLSANGQTTIKDTLLTVGVLDINRFSSYYSKLFKERPSETLQKAKRIIGKL